MEDHQHPKTSVHAIVIALAILNAVGMLVLYFKIELVSAQLDTVIRKIEALDMPALPYYPTTKTPDQNTPIPKKQAWASYENNGLTFNYPESWTLTHYEDEFVQGQQNIRITSSPGVLADRNDPSQKPVVGTFRTGFQVAIQKLATGQDFGRMDDTKYPYIKKLTLQCIDFGCPDAAYLFFGTKDTYNIAIRYNADDTQSDSFYQTISDTFLASLHE